MAQSKQISETEAVVEQSLEASELNVLLHRDRTFTELLRRDRSRIRPRAVRIPANRLPTRGVVIDEIFQMSGGYPPGDLDIEYGTVFANSFIPVSGKLYVKCFFIHCDFEKPNGPYGMVGCLRFSKGVLEPIHVNRSHSTYVTRNILR